MATYPMIPNVGGGLLIGDASAYQPGDILLFEGRYDYIFISGLSGSPGNPIILINSSAGVVTCGGISIPNSQWVKVTGSGSSDEYGFKIDQGTYVGNDGVAVNIADKDSKAAHVEVERFWADQCGFGSWCKNEHFCDASIQEWVLDDIHIHHFKMTNLNHHGFYYGATEQVNETRPSFCEDGTHYYTPSRLGNILIHDGIIQNIGKNGVMVNDVRYGQAEIYNMQISNTGNQLQQDQGTGIAIGGYCNAYVHDNLVDTTWLWNIAAFGVNNIRIENNTCRNAGVNGSNSLPWPQNIMINTNGSNPDPATWVIKNNILSTPGSGVVSLQVYGIRYTANNILCGNRTPSGSAVSMDIEPGVVYVVPEDCVPVDPPPVPDKNILWRGYRTISRVKRNYIIYDDHSWEWQGTQTVYSSRRVLWYGYKTISGVRKKYAVYSDYTWVWK